MSVTNSSGGRTCVAYGKSGRTDGLAGTIANMGRGHRSEPASNGDHFKGVERSRRPDDERWTTAESEPATVCEPFGGGADHVGCRSCEQPIEAGQQFDGLDGGRYHTACL